ncbi:helix-turn-helix transcriptional regulator [Microbacterium caowuchunii]|uniref:HTH luxR-type domain-containing protein n=1 Tax=Microbacterium caowuchunii TaxID=2614638 RepID=A0A5N0TN45_9MICO|nr:helix-turn-helix transcriptional regulator [Microbacterium caowuchunii]KAA9134829.1 hypothetical protein F6B40_03780 [Microbacterium caowuchunii]
MATPDPRSPVLDVIGDAITARTGVVLVGLPGSGRRTLLAHVRRRVEEAGWTVATVPGPADTGTRPLDALALAGLTSSPPGIAGAVHAVTALASSGPALILLTDAHQLDDTSAQVIAAAMDRADITVLATVRPPLYDASALRTVAARRDATVVTIPPLPFDEIHRLVADTLGGDIDAEVAGRVYALSGGLPGIARAICVEARRTGELVNEGTHWSGARDLWTPAWGIPVGRLTAGLTEPEREALWVLAELGPTDVSTVRRAVPWHIVTTLDDRGLVRFVDEDDRSVVALFPPLLEEHLRHRALSARGRSAADLVSAAFRDHPTTPDRPPARPALSTPMRWSSSPEAAAILGRVLREHTASRVIRCRADWERDPTDATALLYLQALLDDGAPVAQMEHVLAAERTRASDRPSLEAVRIRAWEGVFRAFRLHDVPAGLSVLIRAAAQMPHGAAILTATAQHVRLVTGSGTAPELPLVPETGPPNPHADVDGHVDDHGATVDLPPLRAEDVVRMVRGEMLLAGGRTTDARQEFAAVVPVDPVHYDTDALVSLGMLFAGDIRGAVARADRQLDIARGMLDRSQIEPHAYVVALGLYLEGKLTSLRDHLTGVFALDAPAPLRPAARAGLLSISASLSLMEKNLPSARAMLTQLAELDLAGGPFVMTRPEPASASLAIARGVPAHEATRPAWDRIEAFIDDGNFLAAVFDGTRIIDLHVDPDRAARLTEIARAAQGDLVPALGIYIEGALLHSAELLIEAAARLRGENLILHSARAHAMAIRILRDEGRTDRATEESAHLRRLMEDGGEESRLLVSEVAAPAAYLTPRELEIARLIAQGASNRDVAARLVVSERTVDNHLYRIFRKLGITSRSELAGLL